MVNNQENVADKAENAATIADLMRQLKAKYSYDRNWLVQKMAQMAAGQGHQATMDGYINRPAAGPDGLPAI